jgi:hypothetical protein
MGDLFLPSNNIGKKVFNEARHGKVISFKFNSTLGLFNDIRFSLEN